MFGVQEQGSGKGSCEPWGSVQGGQSEFAPPSLIGLRPSGRSPPALASISPLAQQGVGLTLTCGDLEPKPCRPPGPGLSPLPDSRPRHLPASPLRQHLHYGAELFK